MAFLDPIDWASEWAHDQAALYEIAEAMEEYKNDAIKRFKLIAPNFSEAVAATVAFGVNEGLTEAIKIVDYLFLNEKHIAALNEDSEKMDELLYKEKENEKAFDDFDDYMSRQYERD